jgi:hypothetical protein
VPAAAYLFSNDPMHAAPWNPGWTSHKVGDLPAVSSAAKHGWVVTKVVEPRS